MQVQSRSSCTPDVSLQWNHNAQKDLKMISIQKFSSPSPAMDFLFEGDNKSVSLYVLFEISPEFAVIIWYLELLLWMLEHLLRAYKNVELLSNFMLTPLVVH